MKRWVFNPSLNCSRLTEVERRWVGSEFQTTGAATWKLRWPNRVLVRGTSMSQHSAERRCVRPEMSATGRRPSNRLGRCHGHSQKHLWPPCKGSAGALAVYSHIVITNLTANIYRVRHKKQPPKKSSITLSKLTNFNDFWCVKS